MLYVLDGYVAKVTLSLELNVFHFVGETSRVLQTIKGKALSEPTFNNNDSLCLVQMKCSRELWKKIKG